MAKESPTAKRSRGEIETLPSGSLRVKVYAGIDPISKTRMYLRETILAGPTAEREAEKVLARFLREVYERRHPRTDATVQQLIDRHLADAKLGIKTRKNYRSQAEKHIIPCIGQRKVRAVDADISDSFYAELRQPWPAATGGWRTGARFRGEGPGVSSTCDPKSVTPAPPPQPSERRSQRPHRPHRSRLWLK